jgi:hypothetical protein
MPRPANEPIPPATASMKWFPVMTTAKNVATGQTTANAYASARRLTQATTAPNSNDQPRCRLGIAAHGFTEARFLTERPLPYAGQRWRKDQPMTANPSTMTAAPAARPAILTALRVVAPLVALLVFIQAIFAGQGLFIDTDQLDIHGLIGNVTLLLALVQVGLVFFAGLRGRERTTVIAMSLVLLALVIAQIGLGYSGRDGGTPAALHIPNGVAIMALSAGIATYLARIRADAAPR